jgi:chromatin remodeling complex protein RSC6
MVRTTKTTETPAKRTKKTTKAEAAPVVEAAPVEAAPTEAAPAEAAPVDKVSEVALKMSEFSAKLQQMNGMFASMRNDFKTLDKFVSRELKAAAKASSKKRRNTGNRKPSGFIKPTPISEELAKFLGKEVGTEMARTAVSKEINAYIQEHKLQDKANGRIIHADAKLSKLLKLSKDDELTYFNLQRYMKIHFSKAAPAVAA